MPRVRHPKPINYPESDFPLLDHWKRLNPNKPIVEFDQLIASIEYGECLAITSGQFVVRSIQDVQQDTSKKYQAVYLIKTKERRQI